MTKAIDRCSMAFVVLSKRENYYLNGKELNIQK